jgi:hypothetical protein
VLPFFALFTNDSLENHCPARAGKRTRLLQHQWTNIPCLPEPQPKVRMMLMRMFLVNRCHPQKRSCALYLADGSAGVIGLRNIKATLLDTKNGSREASHLSLVKTKIRYQYRVGFATFEELRSWSHDTSAFRGEAIFKGSVWPTRKLGVVRPSTHFLISECASTKANPAAPL